MPCSPTPQAPVPPSSSGFSSAGDVFFFPHRRPSRRRSRLISHFMRQDCGLCFHRRPSRRRSRHARGGGEARQPRSAAACDRRLFIHTAGREQASQPLVARNAVNGPCLHSGGCEQARQPVRRFRPFARGPPDARDRRGPPPAAGARHCAVRGAASRVCAAAACRGHKRRGRQGAWPRVASWVNAMEPRVW